MDGEKKNKTAASRQDKGTKNRERQKQAKQNQLLTEWRMPTPPA
jgi:hypothetical protein